ncbi:MAG: NusG domain II-containing protein [Defluviitaleaceae bacterium]|nr:NusG domain II-containing protein [Defluviitaleaceae bacterium]
MTKKDFIIVGIILILGGLLLVSRYFFRRDDGVFAQITCLFGVTTFSLDDDLIFTLPSNENIVFEIRDGQIAFLESDCPDKVCVHVGFLRRVGQMAVCLPNNTVLAILGEDADSAGIDLFVKNR